MVYSKSTVTNVKQIQPLDGFLFRLTYLDPICFYHVVWEYIRVGFNPNNISFDTGAGTRSRYVFYSLFFYLRGVYDEMVCIQQSMLHFHLSKSSQTRKTIVRAGVDHSDIKRLINLTLFHTFYLCEQVVRSSSKFIYSN